MTARKDEADQVGPDTPASVDRDKRPIPLPEGQPGDDGSDPTPESDMESGLLKPLENTPIVRSPNARPAARDEARDARHEANPLGTRADTGVTPTTEAPGAAKPKKD